MNFNHPLTRYCSAALAYTEGGLVVLVSPKKRRDEYVFPKGGLEPGLSPSFNAAKECLEESGVHCAKEGFSLGVYEILKKGIINRVEVFALEANTSMSTDWTDIFSPEGRDVQIVTIDKALEMVSPYLAPFLMRLASHLDACSVHESRKLRNS